MQLRPVFQPKVNFGMRGHMKSEKERNGKFFYQLRIDG
jgi:hypothetical protein